MATTNLYTGGAEFKLPNGKFYVGSYHVHPTMGAMVGAVHTSRKHSMLMPANEEIEQKVENLKGRRTKGVIPTSSPSRQRTTATPPTPRRRPRVAPRAATRAPRRSTGSSSY